MNIFFIIYFIGVIFSGALAWAQAGEAEDKGENVDHACSAIAVFAILSWIYPLVLLYYNYTRNHE